MAAQEVAHSVPDRFRRGPCVYFVGQDEGPVKIGFSAELPRRLRGLQAQSPVPLKLIAAVEGGRELEREYHRRFASDRMHGEWFRRSEAIEDELATLRWVKPLMENIARFAEQQRRRAKWERGSKRTSTPVYFGDA